MRTGSTIRGKANGIVQSMLRPKRSSGVGTRKVCPTCPWRPRIGNEPCRSITQRLARSRSTARPTNMTYSALRRGRETEEETLEEAVRYLARRVEGRSEIRVRKGVQAAYPWLGPRRQCAALPRGRGPILPRSSASELTPQAIHAFNEAQGKKIGLFHVTC